MFVNLKSEKKIIDEQVLRYFDLIPRQNATALIPEDSGIKTIKQYIRQNKPALSELITITARIASSLAYIHHCGPAHRNIRPENIFINPETKKLILGNFNMAFHVHKNPAAAELIPAVRKEVSLTYISPEETGRMDRSVDFRSDLYSLGICLYDLDQPPLQVKMWRNQLLDAFGPNGQVILDVIPDIERITGKQPPVSKLGFSESQKRFYMVFRNFIGVFADKTHPLVMFLDDLQWADVASLNLMDVMLTEAAAPLNSFCLIGAYRSNEVSSDHPAALMLKQIRDSGLPIEHITLTPLSLSLDDDRSWTGDILHCAPSFSESLSDTVHQKTGGNISGLNGPCLKPGL